MSGAVPWPERVAVLGAGTMGRGIAQQFATHGRAVRCWDERASALAGLPEAIARSVEVAEEAGAISADAARSAAGNITCADALTKAIDGADLVVEAITEDLAAKQQLFGDVDAVASPSAVLASNTSAIDISAIAEACRTPSRVVGTHWFNPPYIVPAVEVVAGKETSDAVLELVCQGLRSIGRIPCRTANTAGFVANRIQFAMIAEAFRCLEERVADARTIDTIVRTSFGPRLASFGIFEIADLNGLDVYASVLAYLDDHLESPAFTPLALLGELTEQGRFGVKSGAGIYEYGAEGGVSLESRDRALYRVFTAVAEGPS